MTEPIRPVQIAAVVRVTDHGVWFRKVKISRRRSGKSKILGAGQVNANRKMTDTGQEPGIPQKNVSRHGKLTAVSMMKDEGPYLLEWVAHHFAVGFTDLVVYTNDCSDGTDDMLIRLQELGLVQHRRNDIPEGMKPQPSALKYAQNEPEVGNSDWIMVFDADEFLCIRQGDGTLDTLIDGIKAAGANGMVITWRIFGSGGVVNWSRDPVSEQYLMAAPQMWNKGWGVKTLFQFDPDKWNLGIHRPKLKNKMLDTGFPETVKWLNGSGRDMEEYFKFRGWRSIVRTIGYDWAQINHYAVKSVDSYAIRKFRGNVNNKADKYNDDYWSLQDRNEVRDDTMLRYSARRSAIVADLLSDSALNRLHFAALERAEARLNSFKATPEYAEFAQKLSIASAVPISQVEAKPPKARDPAGIATKMGDVEKRTGDKRGQQQAKPPQDRVVLPLDNLVRGAVDTSAEVPLEWHANHALSLPADPRIFTPPALLSIEAGKYDRNLARNAAALLGRGARYLELGATTGFLAGQVMRVRPDAEITLVQSDPGWQGAVRTILRYNGIELPVQGGIAAMAAIRPDLLVVGDAAMTPEDLKNIMQTHVPHTIILMGLLWSERHNEIDAFACVAADAGLTLRLPLDPQLSAAFRAEVDDA